MKTLLLLFVLFISIVLNSNSTIRIVPSQYASIQLALSSCANQDTVLVEPGTYTENITWPSVTGISLFSTAGADSTIINGNAAGIVISISGSNNDSDLVIDGFTIMNGSQQTSSAAHGGGISINQVHPTLRNLVVTDNHIGASNWAYGAGIYANQSNLSLINVEIYRNVIDSGSWCYGAGLHAKNGSIKIYGCVIEGNRSYPASWCYGTGIYLSDCTIDMRETIIKENEGFDGASWYYGAGLYAEETGGVLANVQIADNKSPTSGNWHYGAGIYLRSTATVPPVVRLIHGTIANNSSGGTNANSVYNTGDSLIVVNSIIWSSAAGTEVSSNVPAQTIITYSNVEGGYTGSGNINSDPLFAGATDYHLLFTSPCIAAADLNYTLPIDLENNPRPMPAGNNPDMGCYEMDESGAGIFITNEDGAIHVFPNPSTGMITVGNLTGHETIFVYDSKGQLISVQEYESSGKELNLTDMEAGVYFIRVAGNQENTLLRIVLIR